MKISSLLINNLLSSIIFAGGIATVQVRAQHHHHRHRYTQNNKLLTIDAADVQSPSSETAAAEDTSTKYTDGESKTTGRNLNEDEEVLSYSYEEVEFGKQNEVSMMII